MSDKPWDNPEKLAEARWYGGKKHSYEDMADYLGCSTGTISMRMNHKEHYDIEEIDDYGPEDFEDSSPIRRDSGRPGFPLEFDLPDDLPEKFDDGTSMEIVVDDAKANNWYDKLILNDYLQENYDLTLQDVTSEEIEKCPQCEHYTIVYFTDGSKKCGYCGA